MRGVYSMVDFSFQKERVMAVGENVVISVVLAIVRGRYILRCTVYKVRGIEGRGKWEGNDLRNVPCRCRYQH